MAEPGSRDARPRTRQQRAGAAAEAIAAGRLRSTGWEILAANERVGRDEIDLVAVDPGPPRELVVVEVRWRRRRDFGLPEETFDGLKRRRVWRAAMALLGAGTLSDGRDLPRLPLRIDLVVIEPPSRADGPPRVRHHRAALDR
jgi:Holliday junction resolvase-like predicted endonuclease